MRALAGDEMWRLAREPTDLQVPNSPLACATAIAPVLADHPWSQGATRGDRTSTCVLSCVIGVCRTSLFDGCPLSRLTVHRSTSAAAGPSFLLSLHGSGRW